MRGHAGKKQCRGGLFRDRRTPPRRPVGVTSEIITKARGSDKIPDRVSGIFRVGKVEGARHGMKAEGVVVHIQRCEGNGVGTLIRSPHGGRLDGIQHL